MKGSASPLGSSAASSAEGAPPSIRSRGLAGPAAAVGAIAAAAVWAFLPLPKPALPEVDAADTGPSPLQTSTTLAALDTAPFRAPLWIAPPPPPPPAPAAAPPPPPPPMRLQLLAIVQDERGGGYRAVIYDPDADRVLVAAEGEKLAGRTLKKVEAARIELLDHGAVRALSLRDEPSTKGGGS